MPATLRLTGSGVNTGSLFLLRKKEGGVYGSGSRWGVVVPRGGVSEQIRTTFLSFRCITVHIRAGQDKLGSVRIAPNYALEYTLDESE